MAKLTKNHGFFRSKPVHLLSRRALRRIFRRISVHLERASQIFPEQIRSLILDWINPGLPRAGFFRSKSVHSVGLSEYLCIRKIIKSDTEMSGKTKDMSLIKQIIQMWMMGESNRSIGRQLPVNKETVNNYARLIKSNGWKYENLLNMEDPELERLFHAGNAAYTDARMTEFLRLLPEYKRQLTDPRGHVTRQLLYDEYKESHPNGYSQSQFYFHLKQNLVAQKDMVAVLAATYKPGEKLMVDFAGDKLSYVDRETGEVVKVEVFVAVMPYSGYTYVICVESQCTEHFIFAIRMCLEHLGGVPPILTPDNLKSAVIKNDTRHEPDLNKALEDMGNHYHFVVLPCDPGEPTQKALVEDGVRNTYNRIYAKLRNRTFYSLMELNRAVWELMEQYNQTRMQKRPYSRQERFHAQEKGLLKALPAEIYEMRYYADLKVQANCCVELRQNKTTHFYSAPYQYVGKMAHVIFTRSWVNIYVDGVPVASHIRVHEYGYSIEKEHMASNNGAVMERSGAYYVAWGRRTSTDCGNYLAEIYNPERTSQPEEVYYKLSAAILSARRKYEGAVFDKTCRQCLENRIFSYRKFEAILKNNALHADDDEPSLFDAPVPTDHVNMRGPGYFTEI